MFSKIDYKHQQKPILSTKGQSAYKKLEKEMNEAPKDYNSIEKINNNIQSKTVKLIPHQKKK